VTNNLSLIGTTKESLLDKNSEESVDGSGHSLMVVTGNLQATVLVPPARQ
jgi:hypothetical protein